MHDQEQPRRHHLPSTPLHTYHHIQSNSTTMHSVTTCDCAGAEEEVSSNSPDASLHLTLLSSELWSGSAPSNKAVDAPLYANVRLVSGVNTQRAGNTSTEAVYEIQYIAMYAYNGAQTEGSTDIGTHEGDIEHVTVRVTAHGELIAVWYAAHGPQDGAWVPAAEVQTDKATGRLIVYVARGSHAAYPMPGKWWYVQLLQNADFAIDSTAKGGAVWAPTAVHIISADGDIYGSMLWLNSTEDIAYTEAQPFPGTSPADVTVQMNSMPWNSWAIRWGAVVSKSSVVDAQNPRSPARQSWYYQLEALQGRNYGDWDTRK